MAARIFGFIGWLLLMPWMMKAQPELKVELHNHQNMGDLHSALYITPDNGNEITYEEAKELHFLPSNHYKKLDPANIYWGRITFVNKMSEVTDWVLHTGFNNLTDIYIQQGKKITQKRSGELLATSAKDIKEVRKDCVFKLRLLPEQETTVYIRIQSKTGYAPAFGLSLETEESWEIRDRQYYVLQSLFFGALLIMMCYNFAVYISTRDRGYGYYAAFIGSSLIYFSWYHGFIHLFFLPELPQLSIYLWIFSIIMPILYLGFIRFLLDLPHKNPKIDKYIQYTVNLNAAVAVVALSISMVSYDMALGVQLVNATLVVDAFVFAVLLYQLFSLDNKLIRYFLAGVLFFLVVALGGVVSYTYFNWYGAVYAVQAGIIGQIMLHSLGLGHKMRAAERERNRVQQQLIKQLEENHLLQEEANQKLEEKVKARTLEIEEQKDQISEQNEELLALNEEKNNLIRIVAHDLKSPLNRITGLINVIMLSPDNLTGEQSTYLDLITTTSQKLRKMVMRILDADAIEEHDAKLDIEVLNVAELVSQRTLDFKARAEEKYLQLHLDKFEDYLPVSLDASYFEQVFENLLSNAIKFSPKGKEVFVGLKKSQGKAIIYIKDQGPGLTEDDKEKLFKKYQKLSAQPTGGEQSTGLGLSIVKKYVDLLEGDIWCESTAGQGATFFLSFNITQQEAMVA